MKKIKLLFKMVLLGLFLIGCVFRSQERVCAAEMEVECVLHKVEICNICWHDFNSELCPHTKGVIYGGNECKTYDEKYCGLCGAKIGECEHEEGNHMVVLNVNRGKNVIFAEIIILTLMERVRIGKGSIMVGKNVLHMKYMYVIYVEKIIGEVIARIMKGLGMMRDIVNLIN